MDLLKVALLCVLLLAGFVAAREVRELDTQRKLIGGHGVSRARLVHRDAPDSPFKRTFKSLKQRAKVYAKQGKARARTLRRRILGRMPSTLPALTSKSVSEVHAVTYAALSNSDLDLVNSDNNAGDFYVVIGIGTPVQTQYLIFDTGSDLNWSLCGCQDPGTQYCYTPNFPEFQSGSSSTYKAIPCTNTTYCNTQEVPNPNTCASGDQCAYDYGYGSGLVEGYLATETFTIPAYNGESAVTVPQVVFGCSVIAEGFSYTNGLLGAGRSPYSFTTAYDSNTFSICLTPYSDFGSNSLVEFGSQATSVSGLTFMSLLTNTHTLKIFYYVPLTSLTVGTTKVAISSSDINLSSATSGTIFDSGTTLGAIESTYFNSVVSAIKAQVKNAKVNTNLQSQTGLTPCYTTSSSTTFPTMTLTFTGGATIVLPGLNGYMLNVATNGYCFAVVSESSGPNILGGTFLQNQYVAFDVPNSRVGIKAVSSCSGL